MLAAQVERLLERGREPDPAAEGTLDPELVARDPADRVAPRIDLEGYRPRATLVIGHARKCSPPESPCREGSSLIFSVPHYSASEVARPAVGVPTSASASAIASREWISSFW